MIDGVGPGVVGADEGGAGVEGAGFEGGVLDDAQHVVGEGGEVARSGTFLGA